MLLLKGAPAVLPSKASHLPCAALRREPAPLPTDMTIPGPGTARPIPGLMPAPASSARSCGTALAPLAAPKAAACDTAGTATDLCCHESLSECDAAGPLPEPGPLSLLSSMLGAPGTAAPSAGAGAGLAAPQRTASFTLGAHGSPLGSPVQPPGFLSPPGPPRPAPALPGSPTAAASPRSVRIVGSVRLKGDQILPLPQGPFAAEAARGDFLFPLLAAQQPPLAGAAGAGSGAAAPGSGLEVRACAAGVRCCCCCWLLHALLGDACTAK